MYYDKEGNEVPHWSLAYMTDDERKRCEAVEVIEQAWDKIRNLYQDRPLEELFSNEIFQGAIWYASTKVLPHLEVQVVIDSNGKAFASTGSAGYVDYSINPIREGMKLPVKCWIHTHPFGSAYFSATDWRTVSTYQPVMESAYVLGGKGHYGFWQKSDPDTLRIYTDYRFDRLQTFHRLNTMNLMVMREEE